MKRFRIRLLLVLAFMGVYVITSAQPAINFSSLNDVIPADPSITMGTLPNGIKYYIKVNKKPEKRAEFRLAIHAGSILEDPDQLGLAHFCEHMCFNGTTNFPSNDVVNYLESIGVRFGNDLNAYTSFDETVYMLQVPTDNDTAFNKSFQVLEDWGHNVTFADNEIDKERGVILEEWRLGKGAEDRIYRKEAPFLFYNSRYAEREPIGDTNIIEHGPYSALKRFYHDWYRPDLMAVFAVGDFDPAVVLAKIKEHFSNIPAPANERERTIYTLPDNPKPLVTVNTDKELRFPTVQIIFKHPQGQMETYQAYRQSIVSNLFCQMLNTRLDELRKKSDPPFLYAGTDESNFISTTRAFSMMAYEKGDAIMKGFETLLTEGFRVMKHGFTKTEFERAKLDVMKSMEQANAESDKTESSALIGEYVRNFLTKEPIPGVAYEYGLYKKFVPAITLDEVNKLSNEYIKQNDLVITVSAPDRPEVKVPTENDVMTAFNKISKEDIPAYNDVVSDKPLFDKKLVPGKIVKESEISEIGVTKWELSNGLKVELKPTTFKNDEILYTSYAPGGTSLASDADFLSASNASRLINEGGVASFSDDQLQKMLAGKVASASASIDALGEGISGSSAPSDIETMFQLINLRFTEPRKDPETYRSFIDKMKSQLEDSKNDPNSVFRDSLTVTMTNHNFRTRPLTEGMLKDINLDKAFEFYKERFADAGNFTFYFVGNFTTESIKPYILKYLGSLPSKGPKETWKDVGIRYPKGEVDKKVYKGVEPRSTVYLSINGKLDWSLPNIIKLESMVEILNIRLREELREDKSGVYGVGAFSSPKHFPNSEYSIGVYFNCNPTRVAELIGDVQDQINIMKDSLPGANYVEKVKEIQKREREKTLKENGSWVQLLKSYDTNKDDPRLILEKTKIVDSLTPEEIQKTAKQYLNLDNFAKIVLYPEGKE